MRNFNQTNVGQRIFGDRNDRVSVFGTVEVRPVLTLRLRLDAKQPLAILGCRAGSMPGAATSPVILAAGPQRPSATVSPRLWHASRHYGRTACRAAA
jgi:hypothetical protein